MKKTINEFGIDITCSESAEMNPTLVRGIGNPEDVLYHPKRFRYHTPAHSESFDTDTPAGRSKQASISKSGKENSGLDG